MTKKPAPAKQIDEEEKGEKLTPNQRLFCKLYAGMGERGYLGNATQSYAAAYEIPETIEVEEMNEELEEMVTVKKANPAFANARQSASQLLLKPHISTQVSKLFKQQFNDTTVDNELIKTIMQDDDLRSKVQAIKEFNELKGRITKKVKLSGGIKSNLNDAQLAAIAGQVLKRQEKKK